ncbi:MAG: hypothetical protein JWN43_3546 [Gammaproteobacteria bacterium]|nr:hypothetical protein [Gammaproteobacteria bacterium]
MKRAPGRPAIVKESTLWKSYLEPLAGKLSPVPLCLHTARQNVRSIRAERIRYDWPRRQCDTV